MITLLIMCLVLPGLLLHWAYAGVQERKVSLSLKVNDVDSWFDDLDDDSSGFLELNEIVSLLHRMTVMRPTEAELIDFCMSEQSSWVEWLQAQGLAEKGHRPLQHEDQDRRNFWQDKNEEGRDPTKELKAMRKTMLEIHDVYADREGGEKILQDLSVAERSVAEIPPVSRAQFGCWMQYKIESMASTPYDVLYGTTKCSAYYWFAQVLLLKTIINILFYFGSASEFEWHVWMHLTLGISVCLMVLVAPYRDEYEMKVELFALMCLAVITHVGSIYQEGEEFGVSYLALVFVLTSVPIVVLVVLKVMAAKQAKRIGALASTHTGASGRAGKEGVERRRG